MKLLELLNQVELNIPTKEVGFDYKDYYEGTLIVRSFGDKKDVKQNPDSNDNRGKYYRQLIIAKVATNDFTGEKTLVGKLKWIIFDTNDAWEEIETAISQNKTTNIALAGRKYAKLQYDEAYEFEGNNGTASCKYDHLIVDSNEDMQTKARNLYRHRFENKTTIDNTTAN